MQRLPMPLASNIYHHNYNLALMLFSLQNHSCWWTSGSLVRFFLPFALLMSVHLELENLLHGWKYSNVFTVAGTLTLSSKLTHFLFAAISIATYAQKADLVFDETITSVNLHLNGSHITGEDEIVHALAKVGELSEIAPRLIENLRLCVD